MTLEQIALDTPATEIVSHGDPRIQFSQAVSLKRIADALEEGMTVIPHPNPNWPSPRLNVEPKCPVCDDLGTDAGCPVCGRKWAFFGPDGIDRARKAKQQTATDVQAWRQAALAEHPRPILDAAIDDLAAISLSGHHGVVRRIIAEANKSDAGRTTSPEMASLAAKYMGMDDNEMTATTQGETILLSQFFADIRSLAASVLSQVEPK